MAQPVIYLDKSMFLNFTMDFVVLALTARLSGYKASIGRLSAGALLGSIYILVIFLPEISSLYNFGVKLLYSGLIVAVTYYPLKIKKLLVLLGYFYAVSFALGGAIYGFSALSISLNGTNNYPALLVLVRGTDRLMNVLVWGFPGALIFWLTFGRWSWAMLKRGLARTVLRFPLSIMFGTIVVESEGLLDTGNCLRDPLTKHPVVVVEAELILPHLPESFAEYLLAGDFSGLETSVRGTVWEHRLRLIPFKSVGNSAGLMAGLVPDGIIVTTPAGAVMTRKVIVGLFAEKLCADGAYRALLHPDLLPAAG
ncbi:MAG TPA: sigma-E processing peptidase SpoIIGA [Desulfobacteria bacterium]|nr:sigma-E processing peptidase SpoIIGA [Desulfobacteria bacterium]